MLIQHPLLLKPDMITNSVRDSYRDRADISQIDGTAQTGFTRDCISGDLNRDSTRAWVYKAELTTDAPVPAEVN